MHILGLSPSWYKSRAYRARSVRNPRAVLKEFGTDLPATQSVVVHDSTADTRWEVEHFSHSYFEGGRGGDSTADTRCETLSVNRR